MSQRYSAASSFKGHGLWVQANPLNSGPHHFLAVILVRLLNLIKAQFPHLYNGGNNAYFLG